MNWLEEYNKDKKGCHDCSDGCQEPDGGYDCKEWKRKRPYHNRTRTKSGRWRRKRSDTGKSRRKRGLEKEKKVVI